MPCQVGEPGVASYRLSVMKRAIGAVAALTIAAAGCTGASPHPAPLKGTVFFAFVNVHRGGSDPVRKDGVDALSAATGRVIRQVAPAQRDGMQVAGISRADGHSLLVTYARGPACTSDIAGCGPRPNTCGARVVRINIETGTTTTVWRLGADQLLGSARLSPDGSMLAALASPCVPSYFNDHLVVRRMTDGATWTIGAGLPRCHLLGAPQWAGNGAQLLVTYAPATGTTPYSGADGTCSSFGDSSLKIVDATKPQPELAGPGLAPAPTCSWQATATTSTDVFAVQACGHDANRLDGPVSLIRLSTALRSTGRWSVGRCTGGNNLTASPTQGVLLAAYLFCNPPPRGQPQQNPSTTLFHLQNNKLQRVGVVNGGTTAWDDLTW